MSCLARVTSCHCRPDRARARMATGVRLEDALPPELNFVSVQTSQGGGTNDNGTVRCELGTLAPGSNSTVTVQVVPTVLGLVTNTVIVSATETDLEPTNNTASLV